MVDLLGDGVVSGSVDAATCNIGIHYGPATSGTAISADVFGDNYFGVLVNGAAVDVADGSVHDIGETPIRLWRRRFLACSNMTGIGQAGRSVVPPCGTPIRSLTQGPAGEGRITHGCPGCQSRRHG